MATDRPASRSSMRSGTMKPISKSEQAGPTPSEPSASTLTSAAPTTEPPRIAAMTNKELPPQPSTPQRKPVQHRKSPLSSEAFSSPGSNAPGAYRHSPSPSTPRSTTPQFHAAAYSGNTSVGKKRLSSFGRLFPFKSMRKSYDQSSPEMEHSRPETPGADSLLSHDTKPSLRKKMSGSFWKRSASAGASYPSNGETEISTDGQSTNEGSSIYLSNGSAPETRVSGSPSNGNALPLKKRKSATFWRRKSSLTLADQFNGTDSEAAPEPPKVGAVNGHMDANGQDYGSSPGNQASQTNGHSDMMSTMSVRTHSPPPQISLNVEDDGGGFGIDQTLFDSIEQRAESQLHLR